MDKQLILLAGLQKTATTSIQRTCALHQGRLRQAGIVYPVMRVGDRNDANHTSLLNLLFKREPNRLGLHGQLVMDHLAASPEDRQAMARQLEEQIADVPALLMAAEGVSVMSQEELRSLREWFEQRGWGVRVLCHVRHVGSWIQSMVAQRVARGMRMTIGGAIEEFRLDGSIVKRRIENLRAVFPDVELYSHELALRHPGGPVASFFTRIGYEGLAELKMVNANPGPGDCATRCLSVLNERFGVHLLNGAPNPEAFSDRAVLKLLRSLGRHKFVLRPKEVEPLMPLLQADNEWLRDTLGEAFFDPALHFPPSRSKWDQESVKKLRQALKAMPPEVREWMKGNLPRLGLRQAAPAAPAQLH